MTAPNASAIARVEKKLDDLGANVTSILERLASIEATSSAEARERATVHHYTQTALNDLAGRINETMLRSVYETEHNTLLDRVKALEDRNKMWMTVAVLPVIATVAAALIIYAILGH